MAAARGSTTDLASLGQGHLTDAVRAADKATGKALAKNIEAADVPLAVGLYTLTVKGKAASKAEVRMAEAAVGKVRAKAMAKAGKASKAKVKEWTDVFVADDKAQAQKRAKMEQIGLEEVRQSRVAVCTMAGGQGTRLGSSDPKGMYDIGLPSGKTLFHLQADRILAVQRLAGGGIVRWYIMTSPATHAPTAAYLKKNKFFGLRKDQVRLFQQGMLPAFDNDGKIILSGEDTLAMSPNGNGGIYEALHKEGIIAEMSKLDIRHLHVCSIDNALVKMADPVFTGYCMSKKAECGGKVVRKTDPEERVAIIGKVGGKARVVEYTEIADLAYVKSKKDPSLLMYRTGNPCIHYYSLAFLKRTVSSPLVHIAKKKIPFWDADEEEVVTPEKENGIKLEMFIFDVFSSAKRFAVMEVERASEFAPVKNANDKAATDTPDTARAMVLALHTGWVKRAGGKPKGDVEVDAALSYAGEGLKSLKGAKVSGHIGGDDAESGSDDESGSDSDESGSDSDESGSDESGSDESGSDASGSDESGSDESDESNDSDSS